MTGVDLTRIDGVDAYTALKVISEIGADMTKWPSAKHFASWLGLSPNNRITGGKVISSKAKPSANRAAAALRLAANALHRSDSALGAFLRRKKAHLGAPKAITATAHKLARLIYTMLRYGQAYVDAGGDRRQLVLLVATTIFAGRDGVIIRYGGTVDYRPTNQAIEAETYGRQDTGNGSGQGWDERTFSAQVAEWAIAVAGETGASVAHPSRPLRRGVGG